MFAESMQSHNSFHCKIRRPANRVCLFLGEFQQEVQVAAIFLASPNAAQLAGVEENESGPRRKLADVFAGYHYLTRRKYPAILGIVLREARVSSVESAGTETLRCPIARSLR